MKRPKHVTGAIIFDLDGTLADTLADIAAAANHALGQLGHAPIQTPRYRYLAGQGLRWLMEHALGPDHQHQVDEGMRIFRVYYADHDRDHTRPYEGIDDLLTALTAAGRDLALGVLSNKPDPATQQLVSDLFGSTFDHVAGAREGVPLKPDPTSALAMCQAMGVTPDEVLYVGDTSVDMETAVAAGFFPVGVLWGFRDETELRESGARAIIARPGELLGLL